MGPSPSHIARWRHKLNFCAWSYVNVSHSQAYQLKIFHEDLSATMCTVCATVCRGPMVMFWLVAATCFSVGLFVNSVTTKSWIDFNNRRRDSPVAGGGSTLGAGRRPPNCGRPPNLAVLLTYCGQLILRKNSIFDATRCQIVRLKCTKFDFRWGSAPDIAPQTP